MTNRNGTGGTPAKPQPDPDQTQRVPEIQKVIDECFTTRPEDRINDQK